MPSSAPSRPPRADAADPPAGPPPGGRAQEPAAQPVAPAQPLLGPERHARGALTLLLELDARHRSREHALEGRLLELLTPRDRVLRPPLDAREVGSHGLAARRLQH